MELETEAHDTEQAAADQRDLKRSAGHYASEAAQSDGRAPVTAKQPQRPARAKGAEGDS